MFDQSWLVLYNLCEAFGSRQLLDLALFSSKGASQVLKILNKVVGLTLTEKSCHTQQKFVGKVTFLSSLRSPPWAT